MALFQSSGVTVFMELFVAGREHITLRPTFQAIAHLNRRHAQKTSRTPLLTFAEEEKNGGN